MNNDKYKLFLSSGWFPKLTTQKVNPVSHIEQVHKNCVAPKLAWFGHEESKTHRIQSIKSHNNFKLKCENRTFYMFLIKVQVSAIKCAAFGNLILQSIGFLLDELLKIFYFFYQFCISIFKNDSMLAPRWFYKVLSALPVQAWVMWFFVSEASELLLYSFWMR